ncbi:MAG: SBBP repeat-containing protein [Candidatus Paceibacterota bacterium]
MINFVIKPRFLFSFLIVLLLFSFFSFNKAQAADGDFVWAQYVNSDSAINLYSSKVDDSKNSYLAGTFSGAVIFDTGVGAVELTSTGLGDIFILKLDADGDFVWVKTIAGNGSIPYSMSLDSSGNPYLTGGFTDTVDFDPGVGVANLTSEGNTDIFILKLNADGDFVWAHSFGSPDEADYGQSLVVDSNDNIHIVGEFYDTVDFDPGVGVTNLDSIAKSSLFILKLDADGAFIWGRSLPSLTAFSINVDSLESSYITGTFASTRDFDPGVGVSNLTSNGGDDIFILKLDADGDFAWARRVGGTDTDQSNSITVDENQNTYVTGSFTSTADFDPGVGVSNLTSNGGDDIFILKLDADGDFAWVKHIGADYDEAGHYLVAGSDGLYITGYFETYDAVIVDFDPGVGVSSLASNTDADVFILKLDVDGDFVWVKGLGGDYSDLGKSISLDSEGNVYVAGEFYGLVDFDAEGDGYISGEDTNNGSVFLLKLEKALSAPVIYEVTPIGVVVNNNAPSYTFNSNSIGDITYGGACSSTTTLATVGNNTINFNNLTPGYYSNCTITLTDSEDNISNILSVTPFSLVVHSGGGASVQNANTPNPVQVPAPVAQPTEIEVPQIPITPTLPIFNQQQCQSNLILTQNLKAGARDGIYHSYTNAIVKEVKILQTHMNRLGFNSGKVDGVLGPITDGAIKRMQAYLGTKQDGLVGPITRGLINTSCN